MHLESGEVAAYLDRVLTPAERDRVEGHLADCAACRREVTAVSRLRISRRSPWRLVAPALAAAAAIIAFLLVRPVVPPGADTVLRDGDGTAAQVSLVSPVEDATVVPAAFTWRSVGAAASYRLVVTNDLGDVLLSATTSDTTARVPRGVSLRAGAIYTWYVDALMPDGRSATSGIRSFRMRP